MRSENLDELIRQFPDIDDFWHSNDLVQTESLIQRTLPQSEPPQWTTKDIETLTQLARVQVLQKKFTDARVTLDRVRLLLPQEPEISTARVRYFLEEGRFRCLSMSPSKARDFFIQAWDMAGQNDRIFHAIDAALMISISQPPKFPNEWQKRALSIAEQTTDTPSKLWLTHLYMLEGWSAFDFRNYEVAMESFKRALARPKDQGETINQMVIQWSMARVLRALDRTPEALVLQQALHDQLFNESKTDGHVELEIAECLNLMGKVEEAKPFYESAHTHLSANSWYADNKIDELARMKYLAKKR